MWAFLEHSVVVAGYGIWKYMKARKNKYESRGAEDAGHEYAERENDGPSSKT